MYIETVFVIDPTPAQKEWLHTQLKASKALIRDAITRAENKESSLFGRPILFLEKVVPDCAGLSSYVSYGMSSITAAQLVKRFPKGFLYRSSKTGSIQQFSDGHFYISGVPGQRMVVHDPNILPASEHYVISNVQFDYTPTADHWSMTVRQRAIRPKRLS